MEFWKNYGILKRKFHIWKNYGIWAKWLYLWKNCGIFVLGGKMRTFFFKKWGGGGGGNTSGLRNVVSMFVASVITSLGLALRTSRAIALARYRWTEWTASSAVGLTWEMIIFSFSVKTSRVALPEASQGLSKGNWLSQSVPLLSPSVSLSLSASRDIKWA